LLSSNQLKKQNAQIKLQLAAANIVEESSQFDESQQYFLVPSPEVKRTIENKLTSTVLDTTFRCLDYDYEIEPVSVSQISISTPPRRLIDCETFVDRDSSVVCFENPLCDTFIEQQEVVEEKTFGRVNSGLVNLPNTDVFIESYGFSSNQFQTANTFLFAQNNETIQDEIFV
jgi:hypothetical protein